MQAALIQVLGLLILSEVFPQSGLKQDHFRGATIEVQGDGIANGSDHSNLCDMLVGAHGGILGRKAGIWEPEALRVRVIDK